MDSIGKEDAEVAQLKTLKHHGAGERVTSSPVYHYSRFFCLLATSSFHSKPSTAMAVLAAPLAPALTYRTRANRVPRDSIFQTPLLGGTQFKRGLNSRGGFIFSITNQERIDNFFTKYSQEVYHFSSFLTAFFLMFMTTREDQHTNAGAITVEK